MRVWLGRLQRLRHCDHLRGVAHVEDFEMVKQPDFLTQAGSHKPDGASFIFASRGEVDPDRIIYYVHLVGCGQG